MSILSIVLFICSTLIFLLLYLPNKKKYEAYVTALDKEEFPFKEFMCVGFAFMEKIRYQYNNKIDRDFRRKIPELHAQEYTEFYLRAYWAAAATYLWLGLFIASLLYLASNDIMILVFGLAVVVLLIASVPQDINKKIQEKHLKIALDLPDYISKIIILTGAGLTLRAAMKKVSDDMSLETPLYTLLGGAMKSIDNGMNETIALETMLVQCNMPELRRLVAVIEQNLQRGGSDVTIAMRTIGDEMWTNRKSKAQQITAEAETKMLFPMMMMMIAVMLVCIVPALLSMQI